MLILIKALHSHIKNKEKESNLPNAIHLMLSKMVIKANAKFENIENQPILTEATILDPRFKKKHLIISIHIKKRTKSCKNYSFKSKSSRK